MCKPKRLKQQGMTLIELIVSLLIVTIAMGGVYIALSSLHQTMHHPEQLLKALNTLEYYQDRIQNIEGQGCALKDSLAQTFCQAIKSNEAQQINLEEPFWSTPQHQSLRLLISRPYENNANIVKINLKLVQEDRTLFQTHFLKAIS